MGVILYNHVHEMDGYASYRFHITAYTGIMIIEKEA